MGFETILPFLRPVAHLLQDDTVTELMINGSQSVFVERAGRLERIPDVRLEERNLRVAAKNIARALGDDVSEAKPILDARLPDGSRVAALLPPCSLGGTTLTIRKFSYRAFDVPELVRVSTLTQRAADLLHQAIERRENILIAGGTGTGKTTLLNALAGLIPDQDRIVLIEETAELRIDAPHLVRFESRREQSDLAPVTIRDLVRASLRHRPDRLIVGEVRGGEAYDLLQAWNTGHAGSLSTIHASSASQALDRFTSCVLQSGIELPYQAIRHAIAGCVEWCAYMARVQDRRVMTELVRVVAHDPGRDTYSTQDELTDDHES